MEDAEIRRDNRVMGSDTLDFEQRFYALTGNKPFPWQTALYDRFIAGDVPRSCNLPTGVGKTSVIAVWLIALATGANVPRRLVYVVNRRTVVDQTTNEAIKLRDNAAKIGINHLAISTLRGQFADNQEWSVDPFQPAIICGTVDMIGSRLLFSGYRIGFKSRPLHAGFLGQHALLVHDEAHLEPAFQKLIEAIQSEQDRCKEFARFHVMALSATARGDNGNAQADEYKPFGLTEQENQPPDVIPDPPTEPIHHVWRRLKAKKSLRLHEVSGDTLAEHIAGLASKHKDTDAAVLIYVRSLEDVTTVEKELKKTKRPVVLLTGTMRGKERDELVEKPEFKRFLKGAEPGETVYLICTSAGEVGIDISAEQMVCDLSTFESMAQRLGRVHRYGEPISHVARIDVVHPASFGRVDKKTGELKVNKIDVRRSRTLEILRQLPSLEDNLHDASPKALGDLRERSDLPYKVEDAFAPEPTILPATDILFDAWAMTSIRQPMPGRPPVEPYLHGTADWQPPETYVAWREEVEVISGDLLDRYSPLDLRNLLEDYPIKPHELLRDRSDRVFEQLAALANRHADKPVWVIDDRGAVEVTTLGKLVAGLGQLKAKERDEQINGCTILLPPYVGGLSNAGTLDSSSEHHSDHPNGYDVAEHWLDANGQPRRKRLFSDDRKPDGPTGMALIRTIDTDPDGDEFEPPEIETGSEEEEGASTKQRRFWHWYAQPRNAEDATRASARPVTWDDHTKDVVQRTTQIVSALKLRNDLEQAVILAAELHDLGKKREQWQRSIGNPNPSDWYAKPGKPDNGPRWRPQYLSPYRHEFGSALDVLDANGQHATKLAKLSQDMQDLVLHLIAAHHGRARPHFDLDEMFDPEHPSRDAEALAMETPRRFACLQRKYGRWGLAYLESLLRAADWAASTEPSACVDGSEATR